MKRILLCFFTTIAAANFHAQVSLASTAGTTTGTYTTLKGAFDAINAGTHQGAITINITANTTETASAVLNANGSGAVYTSVVVKPATGVNATISGSVDSAPLIKILGSNITFDGSNTVNGTTRNLTITNTSVTAPQVFSATSALATAPITNLVLKNSNIINGTNTSSAVVFTDGATPTPAGGYFNNITIQNNSIQKSYIAIYLFAANAVGNGASTQVKDNSLNATGTNAIRLAGVYLQGVDGGQVSNNTIGNFDAANAEIRRGVWFATGTVNSSITSNTIENLSYTGTGAGGAAGITVTSGNTGSSAIANVLVQGNTISNFTSSGTGTVFAGIYMAGTLTNGITIDKNRINTISNTNALGYGAQGIYLASTNPAANTLVTNNVINGVSGYGYATAGGVNDNGNGMIVTAGGGYKIYYNTVVMNVNQTVAGRPSAFNATSGVTAAGAIDLRNNMFVNNQTQAGDRYAIYSGAPNTVFSPINNNNYFSAGTSLGYIGSARATLADIQTGFGGNANSVNVAPVFASATNFRLEIAANPNLDNKGAPIAGITVDADNATRNATTPDLGSYEFVVQVLATGEQSLAAKKGVTYYPNPVIDVLNLRSEVKITNVEGFNLSGQKVISEIINAEQGAIDMRGVPAGVYILKVNSDKGYESIKVIKK